MKKKKAGEPFAILSFGGVEIEIDYTVMLKVGMTTSTGLWCKTKSIFTSAIDEILKEMLVAMDETIPHNHRDDKESLYVKDNFRNPLHSSNPEITIES